MRAETPRIAVIGPGAIGGTIAAWLCEVPGNDITLYARTAFPRLVVDVPEGRTIDRALPVVTNPSEASPVDWVIAVTKAYDTESAARFVEKLVGPATRLAVVQNGVEHMERFAEIVPRERTLPVIVDIPAERSAPGRIRQRRHGTLTVPSGALGEVFRALFAGTPMSVVTTDDFLTASWWKLVVNSAGIVNALTRKPAGVVHDPKAAAAMKGIALETIAVGRAIGAKLHDSLADEILDRFRASPRDSVNSLLADALARRRMELDARNGVVVRFGLKYGIPTPLNEFAIAILEAACND
jgi:2-dehydropantoate 2-reductase